MAKNLKHYQPPSENRILTLECQLALAQDRNDSLAASIRKLQFQYDIAMKRIDYLENFLIRLNPILSIDVASLLSQNSKRSE